MLILVVVTGLGSKQVALKWVLTDLSFMFVEHSKYHVRDSSHVVSDMLPTGGKQPNGNRKHDAVILRGLLKKSS